MLIQCPNCGKPISDKAPECIHCKHRLNDNTSQLTPDESSKKEYQALIDYDSLTFKQKKRIKEEFAKEMPEKANILKKGTTQAILTACSLILGIVTVIIRVLSGNPIWWIFNILFLILGIAFTLAYAKTAKMAPDAGDCFIAWAKERNIVNVDLIFQTKKENKGEKKC